MSFGSDFVLTIRRMGAPTLNQRRAGLVKGLLPSSASPVTSADALQLRERAFNRASRWKQSRRSPAGYGKGRFASAHVLRLYPTQAVGQLLRELRRTAGRPSGEQVRVRMRIGAK